MLTLDETIDPRTGRARHNYRFDGKLAPSVTTITRVLDKPALYGWYARTVAEAAAASPSLFDDLSRMGKEMMVAALTAAPDAARNKAADRGTEVHAWGQQLVHGEPVDPPDELRDHVEGYARWLDEFEPVPMYTEALIGNRAAWFVGKFDLLATIAGSTWLLDIKTGSIWPEVAVQLGGYAAAEIVCDPSGLELPMPAVDHIGVVAVTDHGTQLFEPCPVDLAVQWFLDVRAVYTGVRERSRKAFGVRLETPVTLAQIQDQGALF